MELTGYLAVARRWWWTLLVATWVAAIAGFLVASRITPTYEAQAQLLVGPINTDSETLKASGLLVQTYAQLAISPSALKSTGQETGVDPAKLGQNVRATANDTTRILTIRVQDADPKKASEIANTMADELIQVTTGATTRPEGQLEVIGAAVAPTVPVAPQVSLIVLLAMAAGLIGGLVLVIIVEYATDTVRDRSDLARLSNTEVLATIAFDARAPGSSSMPIAEATAPGSANAVAFRLLASKVAFAERDVPTQTIMAGAVGEGDSAVVATGIAAALAGSGHRALVIDASPDGDLTAALGLTGRRGLREVISAGDDPLANVSVGGPAGVRVLPRGETGSSELIAVNRAREILDRLLEEVELVVIDGGSLQRSAGALSWARAAQQSILLVRRGTSRREDLRLAIEGLRFVDATIGGTVLVQRTPGRSLRRDRSAAAAQSGQTRAISSAPAGASAVPGRASDARSSWAQQLAPEPGTLPGVAPGYDLSPRRVETVFERAERTRAPEPTPLPDIAPSGIGPRTTSRSKIEDDVDGDLSTDESTADSLAAGPPPLTAGRSPRRTTRPRQAD